MAKRTTRSSLRDLPNEDIRSMLKKKGITQRAFAKMLDIAPGTFARWMTTGEIADWVKDIMMEKLKSLPDKPKG